MNSLIAFPVPKKQKAVGGGMEASGKMNFVVEEFIHHAYTSLIQDTIRFLNISMSK